MVTTPKLTLDLRRRGIAVLFIHHGNKSGGQRGTSRREDILDFVIQLKRPNDYKTEESVLRSILTRQEGFMEMSKPFLARMEEDENGILNGVIRHLRQLTTKKLSRC